MDVFPRYDGAVETPDRILETALRLFSERGYDAVGVQEIAEASGITKPPLYHHFGSKEGLLEALLEQNYSRWFALLVPATAWHGDLWLAVFNVARTFLKFASSQPAFYRMQLCMSFAPPESAPSRLIAPFVKRQQELLERMLIEAARDRGAYSSSQRANAAMLTAILHSSIGSSQHQTEAEVDELARLTARQFVHAVS